MRIALAQINTSMGAVAENCKRISRFLHQAAKENADLVVFPEFSLNGYPAKDYLDQEGFLSNSLKSLDALAKENEGLSFVVGFAQPVDQRGKGVLNAAAFVSKGKVQMIQGKSLLPTYDIFDEARYFDEAIDHQLFTFQGKKIGITLCEDIWADESVMGRQFYTKHPARELKKKGAEIIINISASPYHLEKEKAREELVKKLVSEFEVPMIFVNLVGGNDEILFDGGSFAVNENGEVLGRCKVFEEDLQVVDLGKKQGKIQEWPVAAEAWKSQALIMGIRDYVKKCGFKKVVIGLSGGIDSALTAVLAVDALGSENVLVVSMPSKYTSQASREDAETLASLLKIEFLTIPIDSLMSSYDDLLANVFRDCQKDVTEENLQARIRGNILMAISNKFGQLVLSTGNKSEMAVGYCTQYGDMAGGLAVISDLPKLDVYKMARFLNGNSKRIPQRIFDKAPSAELKPNQKDEDSLPPYEVLDPILRLYIEECKNVESIVSLGFDKSIVKRVIAMVDQNEFKRRQAAPGLRLSSKAFGFGRRMPIARGPA